MKLLCKSYRQMLHYFCTSSFLLQTTEVGKTQAPLNVRV